MNYQVPPWIPPAPVVAAIGQSVGPSEWRQGRPWIGKAGQVLRGLFREVGLDPDLDVFGTNIENTFHPSDPNYIPSDEEVAAAIPRLEEELALSPTLRVILLAGTTPSKLLFKGRMGEMHGRSATFAGIPTIACYHPSYLLRTNHPRRKAELKGQMLAVYRLIAQTLITGEIPQVILPDYTLKEAIHIG